ncbi:hypothetical protein AAFC00_003154 [Neodothiora populina]|uniref:Cytochrome b5 heme-binding domain-containing protein n=1 Tax=Neodothiora populina TaxID=2781224 RepID=A0ABR3P9I2_9PEZI
MADVRHRKVALPAAAVPANENDKSSNNNNIPQSNSKNNTNSLGVTDVLRILGGLLLLNCAISYFVTNSSVTWGWRPWYSKPGELRAWMAGPLQLTDAELAQYDGADPSKPIYIALNGTIYDVTAGARMYGPGGSYHFFAGRDAARAFVTGCFAEDLTPDLRGAEMAFVPVDDDAEEIGPDGELVRKGGSSGPTKAELKIRRERDLRAARKRVHDTIEGWSKMFKGDGGKNYFKVGMVKRDPDWLDRLPKRQLCQRAQEGRPKRKE